MNEEKILRWEQRGLRGSLPGSFCSEEKHQWETKETRKHNMQNVFSKHSMNAWIESTACIKCGAAKEPSVVFGFVCPELRQLEV